MTKSILQKIFADGKNLCGEELNSEKYISAEEGYAEAYSKLAERLSEEDKNLLIEIDGLVTVMTSAACTEKFIQGFKAGFAFATELLKNWIITARTAKSRPRRPFHNRKILKKAF